MRHSPSDLGRLEECIDPGAPQPAVLSSYRRVQQAARLHVTRIAVNQADRRFMQYTAAAISSKESMPIDRKNDIPLKLRI
ncbi:MAG: hypothetical protein LBN21_01515 [Treponema sp.]|nr:hypothetical protein [Treponema sp.]